jgi:lipopolysaccharide/colanic/teichoic acid biosynthesis glycosyltransferase
MPEEVANYEPWQRERLAVKPGLTCTWQVSGRSDIRFDEWVRLDIEYVRHRGLLLDIKLLLLTVPAVITGRGAY